jgi:TrmH family RNA methyltransferase
MITSVNNPRIKQVIHWRDKGRDRREDQVFVAEGFKMWEEVPPEWIKEIYLTESAMEKLHSSWDLSRSEYELVSEEVFSKMSDTKTPQGILLVLKQPIYEMEEILSRENPLLLLLEELRDPGNLGTIFRTGEGAGVNGILMSPGTADVFHPKVIRATMGSIYRVPFLYLDDWEQGLRQVKEAGVRLYAAHLGGHSTYWNQPYAHGTGFLIGNEGNGLRESTAAMADELIRIPMEGKLESLNAAMAAGLLLYEAKRVRWETL